MQGYQRKFGQSPSQDNLSMLAGYNNGQNLVQNPATHQRMQTPPPSSQSKMATTIQGTGVKMINNQLGSTMKIPQSINNSSQNGIHISGIKNLEINKKIKIENDNLVEKIKELESRGKQSNFDYTKNHIDVANYIMNNYSQYKELINELSEAKIQHLEEVKKNKQLKETNDYFKNIQTGQTSLHPQEQQEQNRQGELNRQIEQSQKENQQLIAQLRQIEMEINSSTNNIQSMAEKTFSSKQEKQQLTEKCNQLQAEINKLTEQLEEQEKRQKEYSANTNKRIFLKNIIQCADKQQKMFTYFK